MNKNRLYSYDTYRTAPRTWRSAYNFEYSIKSLSGLMKKALRDALGNEDFINCKKNTANALAMRCLCDENCKLTHEGRVVAIAGSSLKQQVKALSLPINKVELSYDKSPEIAVREYLLKQHGYNHVCFAEGGDIGILLGCMCFEVVHKAWQVHFQTHHLWSSPDSYMYVSPLGSIDLLDLSENTPDFYRHLMEAIIEAVSTAQKDDIEKAFHTLKQWHADMGWTGDNWPWHNYVGLRLPFIVSLYEALGNEVLTAITKALLNDTCLGKGWPDITAIDKNNNVQLFEIKTSDKLHPSQIITIPALANYFQVEVIKVIKIY